MASSANVNMQSLHLVINGKSQAVSTADPLPPAMSEQDSCRAWPLSVKFTAHLDAEKNT